MDLLEVDGLSKRFGKRRVVDGVGLRVRRGEVVGLLGRNGAGKSTTLRMLAGLLKPSEGSIRFGEDPAARRPPGFIPQGGSLFRRLTAEENLLAVLETRRDLSGDRASRARRMLGEVGLTEVADRKAGTLSGEEAMRLEICRAMIGGPSLLMLDQPYDGVDPVQVEALDSLILGLLKRGTGVLLADHNVVHALEICDRVYVMNEGRILKEGPPSAISGPGPD